MSISYKDYNEKFRLEEQAFAEKQLLTKKHFILGCEPGLGKAICDYEKIPTPSGFKKVGDIKVGDTLFDGDGKPTKVLAVYPQDKPQKVYRVHFSDGRWIDCNEEHLWEVYRKDGRRSVKKTKDINFWYKNARPRVLLNSVEYPHKKTNEINIPDTDYAYFVGYILANGCLAGNHNALIISSRDREIPDKIAKIFGVQARETSTPYSYEFRLQETQQYIGIQSHNLVKRLQQSSVVPKQLIGLNSYEKFIPSEFVFNSIEVRISLLQGLMDGDGSVRADGLRQQISYSSCNQTLAENICHIFRSLGFACSLNADNRKDGTIMYYAHPSISKNSVKNFFTASYHLNKLFDLPDIKHYDRQSITNIEFLGKESDMTCFVVDNERHVFMVGDYIITHNSLPIIHSILEVNKLKDGKAKVLILSSANCIRNMWEAEIVPQKILPENTLIMTSNSSVLGDKPTALCKIKWDVLVVDECQSLFSGITRKSSLFAKLVEKIASKTEYVWGMTGTIVGNNDIEPWCVLHHLYVANCGGMSTHMFRQNYCELVQTWTPAGMKFLPKKLNPEGVKYLENRIKEGVFTWEYSEGDMPEFVREIQTFEVPRTEFYDNALKGILECSINESTFNKTAVVQKVHQTLNGFIYYNDNESGTRKSIRIWENFINPKITWIKENIKEPTVVVYKFEEDYKFLSESLDGFVLCTEVKDFKSKIKTVRNLILLLQCRQGEAFNLQECHHIVYYTLDYSFVSYKQMLHRCWRRGQTDSCKATFLLNVVPTDKNKIETKIYNSLEKKQNLHDLFMSIKGEYV